MTEPHATKTRLHLPLPGRYLIEPAASTVTFVTRHFFGAGAVTGTVPLAGGEVMVGTADNPRHVTVSAAIDTWGIDTGSRRRDQDLRKRRFLDTATYPTMTFRAACRIREDDEPWRLSGLLTVRGTTRPITLTVETPDHQGPAVLARAQTRIDRYDFGITAAKGMAARFLRVTVDVSAAPAPPQVGEV